jgi:hypothetical protein
MELFIVVALLVAAVYFAAKIKGRLHKQESEIGAKLKADIEKINPKV